MRGGFSFQKFLCHFASFALFIFKNLFCFSQLWFEFCWGAVFKMESEQTNLSRLIYGVDVELCLPFQAVSSSLSWDESEFKFMSHFICARSLFSLSCLLSSLSQMCFRKCFYLFMIQCSNGNLSISLQLMQLAQNEC